MKPQLSPQQQKRLFQQHLQQQQHSRQAKNQQKKQQELAKKNPEEHMLYIQKQFKNKSEVVDAAVKKYKNKQIAFDQLMSQYTKTKQYYVAMSYALKTYDRQSYKEALDKMYNSIIQIKKKYQPRKKFKFSRRQEDFGVKAQDNGQKQTVRQNQQNNIKGIQGKNGQNLVLKQQSPVIDSYKIVQCKNTTICLQFKTEILFLKNLKNCVVRAALTKSTVFVQNCNNCALQLSCHQLRIHNSTETTFKIFVTSKAIIQNCSKIVFTPYTYNYENRQQDEKQFERAGKENLWKEVQDFNWLKQGIKSPNFELVQ